MYVAVVVFLVTQAVPVFTMDVIVGNRFELTCPEAPLVWYHRSVQSSYISIIQSISTSTTANRFACVESWHNSSDPSNETCKDGYEIDRKDGKYINVTESDFQDAGMYMCQTNNSNYTFNVTVICSLGSHLNYNGAGKSTYGMSAVEVNLNDTLHFECWTVFSGFSTPELSILLKSQNGSMVLAHLMRSNTESFNNNQSVRIMADLNVTQNYEFRVQCQLTDSLNTDMEYNEWPFRVIHGPYFYDARNNLTLTLPEVNRTLVLNCSAESYPETLYFWFKIVNGSERMSLNAKDFQSTFTVQSSGVYECEATNPRDEAKSKKKTFNVYIYVTDPFMETTTRSTISQEMTVMGASGNKAGRGFVTCLVLLSAITWFVQQ